MRILWFVLPAVLLLAFLAWRLRRFGGPKGEDGPGATDLGYALALERLQVGLYRAQEREAAALGADPHLRAGLRRAQEIEEGHVRILRREIRRLGGASASGEAFSWLGNMVGEASTAGGPGLLLRLNIWAEDHAAQYYRKLLARPANPRLRTVLWRHLIDEESHRAWFAQMLDDPEDMGVGVVREIRRLAGGILRDLTDLEIAVSKAF